MKFNLNDWLAEKITRGVSTMWCAYGFAVLAVIGMPSIHDSPKVWAIWISQTLIQLTMLSIIMVGQRVISEKHDTHADKLDAVHAHLGIGDESNDGNEPASGH